MKAKSKNLKSSNVERVLKIEDNLIIVFKGGVAYKYVNKYPDVISSELDFENICKAESAGKYIHSNIKGNYQSTKLSSDDFSVLLGGCEIEEIK